MNKEALRNLLLKVAASFNCTLGQMIFTVSGLVLLFASVNSFTLLFLLTLFIAGALAWTYRDDLRSGG